VKLSGVMRLNAILLKFTACRMLIDLRKPIFPHEVVIAESQPSIQVLKG
jgi:hypothetical protein